VDRETPSILAAFHLLPLANLIQEQGATVGDSKSALFGAICSGESAFYVAKEF